MPLQTMRPTLQSESNSSAPKGSIEPPRANLAPILGREARQRSATRLQATAKHMPILARPPNDMHNTHTHRERERERKRRHKIEEITEHQSYRGRSPDSHASSSSGVLEDRVVVVGSGKEQLDPQTSKKGHNLQQQQQHNNNIGDWQSQAVERRALRHCTTDDTYNDRQSADRKEARQDEQHSDRYRRGRVAQDRVVLGLRNHHANLATSPVLGANDAVGASESMAERERKTYGKKHKDHKRQQARDGHGSGNDLVQRVVVQLCDGSDRNALLAHAHSPSVSSSTAVQTETRQHTIAINCRKTPV
jgi:hypothetical protein